MLRHKVCETLRLILARRVIDGRESLCSCGYRLRKKSCPSFLRRRSLCHDLGHLRADEVTADGLDREAEADSAGRTHVNVLCRRIGRVNESG